MTTGPGNIVLQFICGILGNYTDEPTTQHQILPCGPDAGSYLRPTFSGFALFFRLPPPTLVPCLFFASRN